MLNACNIGALLIRIEFFWAHYDITIKGTHKTVLVFIFEI